MKDLHIHTKYSDGEYNEFDIIKKVKNAGVTEFAICDHDTIKGSEKVSHLLNNDSRIIFHSGVELTSRVNGYDNGINVHMLARDFDYDEPGINQLISKISNLREQKIDRMVKFIYEKYHVQLGKEEVDNVVKSTNSVGKPHMYKLLCNHGNYDRLEYYRIMDELNSDDLRLDAIDVINTVHKGKGNITLAHPIEIMREYNYNYEQIDKLVAYLKSYGLDGLETRHSSQTEEDYQHFSRIAKKYGLIETCGSDYHGENVKPDVCIGVCEKTNNTMTK